MTNSYPEDNPATAEAFGQSVAYDGVDWVFIERGEIRTDSPPEDMVALRMPDTLREAETAYSRHALFRESINVYAEKNDMEPHEVLSDNLCNRLTIQARLLSISFDGAAEYTVQDATVTPTEFERRTGAVTEGVRDHETVAVNQNPPEVTESPFDGDESDDAEESADESDESEEQADERTVEDVQSEYVKGELTEFELEQELEAVMTDE